MRQKLLIGVVSCTMLLSLAGCAPLGYKLVKVDDNTEVTTQTTQQPEDIVENTEVPMPTTEVTEQPTTEDITTEAPVETTESTEAPNVEVPDDPQYDPNSYDYKSNYGFCFDCEGDLTNFIDEDDYVSYSIKGDMFFDVVMKKSDAFTLDEEIEFIKDVPPGEVIEEKRGDSLSGYDSFYGIYKGDEYYVAKSFIAANGNVFSMECTFDNQQGLEYAKQALESFAYFGEY